MNSLYECKIHKPRGQEYTNGRGKMQGFGECGTTEGLASVVPPDPIVLELNKLHNQIKDKDQLLEDAQREIKALKTTQVLKNKAVQELQAEVKRLDDKNQASENLLEQKNLEMKKLNDEKKEALTAQYAAESTLRRVYASQKENDSLPVESFLAPLEAEIKMYKNENTALLEDIRALERLTKSKEAALLEAERILKSALERALVVEEIQNQNFEIKRQIEICQEENKILDKEYRQKVQEIEKLSQTIKELEEAILAGGAAANTIRDCRRQISQLNEEKRTLERELARAKVSENRTASVAANEWKDENGKLMPVKQWLEERRLLQAEMQRLRDKLTISDKTAKAEAQLKDKLKLRLKTLEEGLKQASNLSANSHSYLGSPTKPNQSYGILSTAGIKRRSASQPRASVIKSSEKTTIDQRATDAARELKQANGLIRKSIWPTRNKILDNSGKENTDRKANATHTAVHGYTNEPAELGNPKSKPDENEEIHEMERASRNTDDMVSGFLYDRLQKELRTLRKTCEAKDGTLNAKEEEIKMLNRRIETLTKAIETEQKKVKREVMMREKNSMPAKLDNIIRNSSSSKRSTKHNGALSTEENKKSGTRS